MRNNNSNACLNINGLHGFTVSFEFSGSGTNEILHRNYQRNSSVVHFISVHLGFCHFFITSFTCQQKIADAYRRANISFLSRHALSSRLSLQEKEKLMPLCISKVNCLQCIAKYLLIYLLLTLCPFSPDGPSGPPGACIDI